MVYILVYKDLKIIGLLKSLIKNKLEVVFNFLIVFDILNSYKYAKTTQSLLQRNATYHWLTGAIPYAGKAEIAEAYPTGKHST